MGHPKSVSDLKRKSLFFISFVENADKNTLLSFLNENK